MTRPNPSLHLAWSLALAIIAGCATPTNDRDTPTREEVAEDLETFERVDLEQKIYVFAPDSEEVIEVEAGGYRVQTRDEDHLLLERIEDDEPRQVLLPAERSDHEDELSEPVVVTSLEEDDRFHIVVFRPDGSVLAAEGSRSGVVARAPRARTQRRQTLSRYTTPTELRRIQRTQRARRARPIPGASEKRVPKAEAAKLPKPSAKQFDPDSARRMQPERLRRVPDGARVQGCAYPLCPVEFPYSERQTLSASLGSICNNCALPSTDVLEVDRTGRIYVKHRSFIRVFNQAGEQLLEFGGRCDPSQDASSYNCADPDGDGPLSPGDGQFKGAIGGLAVGSGGKVYVSDSRNDRIVVFNSSGRYLFAFGTSGSGSGQLDNPEHLDTASNGRVYVADRYNRRIQVFNADGSFYKTIALAGSWSNGLAPAPRIRNGKLYTMSLDFHGCTMRVLTLEGGLILEHDVCRNVLRDGAGGWGDYEDFEVDSQGNYYFLDINAYSNYHGGHIQVTDANFNKIARYSGIYEPRGIHLEEYQRFPKLYIATYSQGSTSLTRFDATQFIPKRLSPVQVAGASGADVARLDDPNDISVSGEYVYVLDRRKDRIVRYDLGGRFQRDFPFSFEDRRNTIWGNDELVVRGRKLVVVEAQRGKVTIRPNIESTQQTSFFYNADAEYTKISALELDVNGNVYVAGKNHREVAVYSSSGQLTRTHNCGSTLYPGPITAIKHDVRSGKLYVASRERIAEIDSEGACNPIPARYFGPIGTFDAVGGDIQGIAVDGAGRIHVLQAYRVQAFDRDWRFLNRFGRRGTDAGELSGAVAIDIAVGNHVLVLQSRWGFSDGIVRQQYQVFKPYGSASVLGVDSDGDGISDGADQCITDAENINGVLDQDGCPDATGMGSP